MSEGFERFAYLIISLFMLQKMKKSWGFLVMDYKLCKYSEIKL